MNKTLIALPVIASLGCGNVIPPKDAAGIEIIPPAPQILTANPKIKEVKDDVRIILARAVDVLGSDLCESYANRTIKVEPFALTTQELYEALNPNSLDGLAWNVPKTINPGQQKHLEQLFVNNTNKLLPFCYSYHAMREGINSLKLPEPLSNKVSSCLQDSEVWNEWNEVEKALHKSGEIPALGVCISHYGGDYDITHASLKNGTWTFAPSCFETVAASHFGYPPTAISPYSAYLDSQRADVLKANECLIKILKESDRG